MPKKKEFTFSNYKGSNEKVSFHFLKVFSKSIPLICFLKRSRDENEFFITIFAFLIELTKLLNAFEVVGILF